MSLGTKQIFELRRVMASKHSEQKRLSKAVAEREEKHAEHPNDEKLRRDLGEKRRRLKSVSEELVDLQKRARESWL